MTSYLKLIHNGIVKTIALYDGIDPQELTGLLTTVFNIQGKVVGVMGEKGLVVPLTLICKSPEVAPKSVCKVLVVGASLPSTNAYVGNTSSSIADSMTPTNDNTSQRIGSDGAVVAEDFSQEPVSDDDSVEYVTQEIRRFLNSLKTQQFLTLTQYRQLLHILNENSNLLFAAYSVAISANDSEYFAEICKDLANSLETEQGQSACEAQDEVLQICDQLYINEKITENQLLYLRHLVLIREEAVAQLYDEFQEHQSVPLFAKSLFELANTHPFQTASSAGSNDDGLNDKGISLDTEDVPSSEEEDDDEEDEDVEEVAVVGGSEDDDDILSPQVPRRKSSAAIAKGLTGVISLLSRSSIISKTEATVLYELVDQENEYVFAAYELYEKNKNLEDLQDTLLRCVKLEIRKRVTDIQEKELEAMERERAMQKRSERSESEDGYEEENDDEDAVEGEENDGERESSDHGEELSLEDISVASILQSLKVANLWEKTVPELFIKTVFISVIRNYLSINQAKALCDLFHARYDLVHAAWEVFTVQRDVTDFIDTLRRIIRDVGVEELRETVEEEMEQPNSTHSTPTATATQKAGTEQNESPDDIDQSNVEQTLQHRKSEALMAVTAAKRELLKHSLEMMVKQKMTTAEKAQDLYARYLSGDVLTDAAIEAYAADRDVGEFLDTLQVLANNSKEDLDILMRAVAAENDQTDEETAKKAKEDIALNQIEEIVNEMLKSDMIGPGIAEEFRKLIRNRDDRLIQAYATYQENKSGAELVNTLLKVVIAAVEGTTKVSGANSASESQTSTSTSTSTTTSSSAAVNQSQSTEKVEKKNEEDDGHAATLDPEDQKTVVEILMRANAVTPDQHKGLLQLIDQRNRQISRIFLSYEENKNVYSLIDALKAVDINALLSAGSNSNNQASTSNGRSDLEEEEESGEDDSYEDDFDDDDGILVEEKFMEIIQNMKLSDLETAALRLAIAENDPSIRTAIDRFRSDLDEASLMRAMKDAARSVIQRTLSSRMGQAFSRGGAEFEDREEKDEEREGEEDANEESRREESQSKEGSNKSSPSQVGKSLLSPSKITANHANYEEEFDEIEDLEDDEDEEEDTGDEGDDDEEEDDDDDGEEEDDEESPDAGNSLLLSQTARDHIFPILVQELVKENIISKADGRIVLQEFAAGNPVISTALDIYDRDNDMAQLVESLQQMVENVQKA